MSIAMNTIEYKIDLLLDRINKLSATLMRVEDRLSLIDDRLISLTKRIDTMKEHVGALLESKNE